ncbi:MAG: glycine oxidase ThiO [Methylovulum sp.]|uniref:glycine oxidase ThiO n=1 Tax=Methylovulum sp. TaxID=1916980 RepID=UPI002619756E|nr:glycine oxidase ThiO [Methylovulum sp.]MDD2723605.1 glycine oxidase ThiO [Methylovulum sp.]
MTTIPDITLIGGGIIGLLTAREFHNAGANVTLIEKNQIGQESSWAGGGILLPIYPWRQAEAISALVLHSLKIYPELMAALLADTGLDPEWTPCGMLITKNPDYQAAIDWCTAHHITSSLPDKPFFNFLNTTAEHPLWLPDIAQVRNPRLLKSLQQDMLNKGITIYEQCELTAIHCRDQRIDSIGTTRGQLPVNQLVITSGAWSGELCQRLFTGLTKNLPDIHPVKGQMLLFDTQPDTLPFMVLDGDHYLIPRRDGKILVGSTVEHDDFNKTTTTAAKNKLSKFALHLFPELHNHPLIKHWAGLRPGTTQGIPYIARHPDINNLSINAGHFRNGLVMGPASAQLLVDLVLKRTPCVAPEPYQLAAAH